MANFYATLAATAARLIAGKGQTVVHKRTTGTHDIAAGSVGSTTVTEGTLQLVVLPASQGTIQAFDDRLVEPYLQGRLRFCIAAASTATFEPQALDTIELDGDLYVLRGMTRLMPAGTPLIYQFGAVRQ